MNKARSVPDYIGAVAAKWDQQAKPTKQRSNFWQFPEICGHLNREICGEMLPGLSDGVARRLAECGTVNQAVSVGCGRAHKEITLLARGIVEHFTLYDLSPARLAEAEKTLERRGLRGRATLICGDAFARPPKPEFDLVYWVSSLHHMTDVHAALQWSHQVLRPGGTLAMWEYIGPTRWQFSEEHYDLMDRFRAALPEEFRPGAVVRRRTVQEMIARDPSEAADSENILPALWSNFPDAEVIMLGGGIYGFGLSGVWPRLVGAPPWVFDMIMAMDAAMSDYHMHACAFAKKSA